RVRGLGAEARLVDAHDVVAGLLELYREEERGRDIYAARLQALRVTNAGRELIRPERFARRVGLAIEEIVVVLADERLRVAYGVGLRVGRLVVLYLKRGRGALAEAAPRDRAEQERERAIPARVAVLRDGTVEV